MTFINSNFTILLCDLQIYCKMGVGTNVQTKLIATHDLDILWRPTDLEQFEVGS